MSKTAELGIVDGKLTVDGIVYEHDQLREVKLYFQQNGITDSHFAAINDEHVDMLHQLIIKMGNISPEYAGNEISFYLN